MYSIINSELAEFKKRLTFSRNFSNIFQAVLITQAIVSQLEKLM